MADTFGWSDIDDIAIALNEAHAELDPMAVRFTQLRDLVESLPGFEPEPGRQVNEQLLEAIQVAWIEEREDADRDEDDSGYTPPIAYRPDE